MIAAIARKSRVGMGPINKQTKLEFGANIWKMAPTNQRRALQACYFLILAVLKRRRQRGRKEKRKHRFWVRSIFQKREELGAFHTLAQELRLDDREYFYR